jgi:predicted nuclease with RNAse H fold
MADVISVDLPWSHGRADRTAIGFRAGHEIHLGGVSQGETLTDSIDRLAEPGALVLLDIPIDGCSELNRDRPYRELDRRLLEVGIPLLPSYKAGGYGATLRGELLRRRPDLRVEESYPYAVLRVLWAARECGVKWSISRDASTISLLSKWRNWPPKYKRARSIAKRREEMARVAEVITESLGTTGAQLLKLPNGLHGGELARISDQYDALLGLAAGIALQDGSPWSWRAQVAGSAGCIISIADRSLRERFHGPGSSV